ncbi:Uncharacterised protein [Chlamydia trachomatis]|nr:Uncharacterised protein [Chlamydia trachomatis]
MTNLRNNQFVVIFVAGYDDGRTPIVLSVPSTAIGLSRSNDLEFVSLQGSNTASLTFDKVELDPQWIVSDNAPAFLEKTRPEFLGYQFGVAFGLAQRSLAEIKANLTRSVVGQFFSLIGSNSRKI